MRGLALALLLAAGAVGAVAWRWSPWALAAKRRKRLAAHKRRVRELERELLDDRREETS
jgi:hypothetical protein